MVPINEKVVIMSGGNGPKRGDKGTKKGSKGK